MRLLRSNLFALIALCWFVMPVWAQNSPTVTHIPLKVDSDKDLKSLSKKMPLYRVAGEPSVMGEIAPGEWRGDKPLEVYVPYLAKKPKISKTLAEAPYEFDNKGELKEIGKFKKLKVKIPVRYLQFQQNGDRRNLVQRKISDFSLYSLCADLDQRREDVVELRDSLKRMRVEDDPDAWNAARAELVLKWEGLVQFVENSLIFRVMGPSLREEFEEGIESFRDAESEARALEFRKQIEELEPEAIEFGKELDCEFYVLESDHVRIVYLIGDEGIEHEHAKELLLLAEESIEYFRRIAIDPFAVFREEQASELPIIPNSLFQEFVVVPHDTPTAEELYAEYYSVPEENARGFDTEARGGIARSRRADPLYSSFTKNIKTGLQGMVVHQVGHTMSSLHYNRLSKEHVANALPMVQEAVAMHLCFEKLGHNTVRCVATEESKYATPKEEVDNRDVQVWDTYRDRFYKLSLDAPSFSDGGTMPMGKLTESNMAKGWLAISYILQQDGVKGQQWLRKMHDSITKEGDGDRTGLDRNKWREFTNELYGEVQGDPLLQFEEAWKAVAEAGIAED